MLYDYSKLSGKIKEKCGTQANFAKKIKLSERSLSLKLNNIRPFKQSEMQAAIEVLDIPECQLSDYFFVSKVQ
ncbi:MAG: DUF739 family protein [Ruminococcaceae bacterium]|nr:DUF739 family protein [Oscillospiraceae bacterium]